MKSFFILSLLFCFHVQAAETIDCFHPANPPDKEAREFTSKLVESFIARSGKAKNAYPVNWTSELKAAELNFNDLTGAKYANGRAYGAIAYQKIALPFAEAKALLEKPGMLVKLIENIETLANTKKVESPKNSEKEFCMQLAIKVPVVSNYQTHVRLKLNNSSEKREIIEWQQIDSFGQMSYNQGAAILEPDGDQSRVTIIGTHVLNKKNKVPWIGRSTAKSFAKVHYGNFIGAVTKTLRK